MDHAGNLNRMGGMKPLLVGRPRCESYIQISCFFSEMFLEFLKNDIESESMKRTAFLPFLNLDPRYNRNVKCMA